ncbi:MAG: HesB/IscA family protein [Rickettsiales endosymbiont of Dermacentor nuttalli]
MSKKRAVISITDNAATQIKILLAKREKPSLGIRVKVKAGGCSGLAYDIEYVDDAELFEEKIEEKGVNVYVDPKAVIYLLGTTMDYIEEKLKSGFVFINPNEKGRCGCGESFHV